jgi:transcriptional regulator with XRE-family HTH domain
MTRAQVANEVGLSVSSLTQVAKGGRGVASGDAGLVRWLAWPAAQFPPASDG